VPRLATKEDLSREISTRVTPSDTQAMLSAGVAPKADISMVESLEARFQSTMQDYMVASEVVDLLGQRATVSEVNQLRSRQDVLVRSTQELSSGVSTISTKIAEASIPTPDSPKPRCVCMCADCFVLGPT